MRQNDELKQATVWAAYLRAARTLLGVEEAAEAVERAGFAEDDEAFEQGWAGGFAGEDGAQQHEVVLDRPLLFGAELLERGLQLILGEWRGFQHGELFGGEGERLFQGARLGQEGLVGGMIRP